MVLTAAFITAFVTSLLIVTIGKGDKPVSGHTRTSVLRPLKFRSYGSRGWLYAEISSDAFVQELVECFRNGPLEQFTGLTDKKGKEIYEGDIVQWVEYARHSHSGLVYFEDGQFYPLSDGFHCCNGRPDFVDNFYTVIGNIHENPSFLGTKT